MQISRGRGFPPKKNRKIDPKIGSQTRKLDDDDDGNRRQTGHDYILRITADKDKAYRIGDR